MAFVKVLLFSGNRKTIVVIVFAMFSTLSTLMPTLALFSLRFSSLCLQSYETDADVRLNALACEVKHRAYINL